MKTRFLAILSMLLLLIAATGCDRGQSTRQERRLIRQGNELYKEKKYKEAQKAYEDALTVNPNSDEARYNLALSQIRQVANPADTTGVAREMTESSRKNFAAVAARAKDKPGLAAKANYNLGNIEFNSKEFQKAIDFYKQSLRIDDGDERTRKNLRIAQKNLKNQDQNKNNQNKNNKDKNNKDQDNKEQNKDRQDKDENQDQNQDQRQNRQNQKEMSQQAASQILQAIDNKESSTRARVNKARKGDKSARGGRNNRRW